jgi:5-methylcytosine-specific restriction endonuclease McrA
MSGRSLQDRRLRMWTKNPHCARCGKLVAYPFGFDLDHVIPLYKGGHDVEGNCQILCNGLGGCHELKTAEDARRN